MKQNLFAALFCLSLSGCSFIGLDRYFGESDIQKWLETESSESTKIPEGLDPPEFVDLMPIPEVDDYRGLSGQAMEVGLPEALNAGFAVE